MADEETKGGGKKAAKAETAKPEAAPAAAAGSLVEQIIDGGRLAHDDNQRAYARDLIGEFVEQILAEEKSLSKDASTLLVERIAQIDELISTQLNEILHHPELQELEGAWRGLNFLVSSSETGSQLKLKVMNVTKTELLKDLEKATEFDQSTLFKKVYEEEYGTFGGMPYSLIVGDYYFSRHPQDLALLEKISNVAAAAHAPFISSVSPKLFNMSSFTEIGVPRDLSKIFESAEMVKWRSFRESEDSRYVALTLPRVLGRLPYGPDTMPVEGVNYVEDTDGTDHSKYLWMNGAYALAQRIINAFSLYGWTAATRGVEGGGLVEGLPAHTFRTQEGDIAIKCPTEVAITDRREKEFSDLGFITLCYAKGTDKAAFFGGQTANKAKKYNTSSANANAELSAKLPYVMAASRFAHYLKVIMRDKVGTFMTASNVATFLNTWIADYVLLDDDAAQEVKAKYPLREARVDVVEIPGRPGVYNATVFLRPHFQLEELTASLRLVAELPAPTA